MVGAAWPGEGLIDDEEAPGIMKIGMSLLFQNVHDNLSDGEVIAGDVALAGMAEDYGFDYVSVVEHHFDSYSMSPDNFQVLAYLAAKTSTIQLQTGVVVLPWHDPVRVAERIILLDYLSGGRVAFGIGRGLAKMEYDGFRQDMNESRERFDESIALIMRALETGIAEGDGPFYKQPPVQLRPAPTSDFKDRFFSVAMSPPSAEAAADIGAAMLIFPSRPIEDEAKTIQAYRDRFEAAHGHGAPNSTFSDLTFCHPDPEFAAKVMFEYGVRQHHSFYGHYSMAGDHWTKTKGYENYVAISKALLASDVESSVNAYNAVQACGTPEQIIAKVRRRVELLGPHVNTTFNFSWGGIPYELVHESVKLFADEVLPELKALDRELAA
jgi:alkanesulfonate monooxygenase SsuD/methylene tetrahydromethanopterin reductase-like flavin-dependent oxidoreductase (luciferase family)